MSQMGFRDSFIYLVNACSVPGASQAEVPGHTYVTKVHSSPRKSSHSTGGVGPTETMSVA